MSRLEATSSNSYTRVVTINNGYTILFSDNGTYFDLDMSSTTFAMTLPAPFSGFHIRITDSTGYMSTNPFTLEPSGGGVLLEGIAGGKIFRTAWGSWLVWSDGTNWFVG